MQGGWVQHMRGGWVQHMQGGGSSTCMGGGFSTCKLGPAHAGRVGPAHAGRVGPAHAGGGAGQWVDQGNPDLGSPACAALVILQPGAPLPHEGEIGFGRGFGVVPVPGRLVVGTRTGMNATGPVLSFLSCLEDPPPESVILCILPLQTSQTAGPQRYGQGCLHVCSRIRQRCLHACSHICQLCLHACSNIDQRCLHACSHISQRCLHVCCSHIGQRAQLTQPSIKGASALFPALLCCRCSRAPVTS